jgi:hypothetical protein
MTSDLSPLYPPPPAPRPEHRSALESELLRRFDARPQPSQRWLRKRPVRRLAFGSVLVAGLAAASQTPVEHAVDVGHRFTVALPPGAALPPPDTFGRALRGAEPATPGKHEVQLELHVRMEEGQGPVLEADVWTEASPADIEARLRAVPEFAGATVSVAPLEGRVRESLAARLGHELFDTPSDPASLEAARQRLQAELAARGEKGQVDVQVDDSEPGQHRVTLKVTRQAPAEGAPAGDAQH